MNVIKSYRYEVVIQELDSDQGSKCASKQNPISKEQYRLTEGI